ncbi:MAG TPA: TPM domain-containing protein [Sphingopyxis sp.]|nr:TPM domain-containing protein [Sphingopyxis sp.]HMP45765.1 TPM domain-containing protein [Sphingopyxis sp.]HMQ20214.1 TPM domain-containing protein [Sphingopyxis sp.]
MTRTILAAPLAILLIAGGCKEAGEAPAAPAALSTDGPCEGVIEIPMQGRVTDSANILTDVEEQRLSDRLARHEAQTKHQIAVATVPSLNGLDPINVATCLGNRWGIGRKSIDDGIVILVAPTERQTAIATGQGIEKTVTNDRAQAVIGLMGPYFAQNDFPGGLGAGIDAIAAQTGGTP